MPSAVSIRLTGFGFVFLACLFAILATAGNYWIKITVTSYETHQGLWRLCIRDFCVDMPKVDWLRATQAFLVMACLAHGIALILGIVLFVKRNLSSAIMGGISFCATIFMMIGMSIYTSQSMSGHHSWSFALGWASCVGGFIGSLILLVGSRYEQLS